MKTRKMQFAAIIGLLLVTGLVIYTIAFEPTVPYYKSTGFVQEWFAAV